MSKREKVIILGNCVGESLRNMLEEYPGFDENFELVRVPVAHMLITEAEQRAVADAALGCDIIFTQPLFSYGPCNTVVLRAALKSGQRLVVFSSPNFEAYFPDVFLLRKREEMTCAPLFDWDSNIIFSCFVRGVSVFEVEEIYRNHAMFTAEVMGEGVAASLRQYALREQEVDLGTGLHVIRNFSTEKLFHFPKHPVDSLLHIMLEQMAEYLGLDVGGTSLAEIARHGFDHKQWPVLTHPHGFFRFAEQTYFVAAWERFSIEDTAMAYYNFYKLNPHIVEANLDRVIKI